MTDFAWRAPSLSRADKGVRKARCQNARACQPHSSGRLVHRHLLLGVDSRGPPGPTGWTQVACRPDKAQLQV